MQHPSGARFSMSDLPDETRLDNERLAHALEQLQLSSVATLINATILAYALWPAIPLRSLLLWWGAVTVISLLRYLTARSFQRAPKRYTNKTWSLLFYAGVIVSAALWGAASLFLFVPGDFAYQAMVIIIVAGMCAGAVSSLSSMLRAMQLFLFLVLGPLFVQLLWQQTPQHNTIALLILLFLLMLLVIARRYHNNVTTTFHSAMMVKRAREQLNLSEERFATIFKEAPTGIFFYDTSLKIIESNQEFAAILKAPIDRVVGLDMTTLPDPRVLPSIRSVLNRLDGFYEGAYHTKLSDTDLWITLRTAPVLDMERNVVGGIGIVSDITERMEAQEKIRHQAYYDMLTGVPNRSLLMERLAQEIIRYRRHRILSGLLFLDLDHFKNINDSLGHRIGDEMLKKTAERLRRILREEDMIARLGGDEFVILLRDLGTDMHQAAAKIETITLKIHDALKRPYEIDGHILSTSTSIGVSLLDDVSTSADDLLKHGDTAMYQAKRDGRGGTRYYRRDMDTWIKKRLQLENSLRQALQDNELQLYYQPIITLHSGNIIGAEALLRWRHRELGFINPEEIVALAEETGMIIPLGRWVLREACRQFREWHDTFSATTQLHKVAVNVSALQFSREEFVDDVRDILEETALPAGSLELELTESVIIDKMETTVAKMKELREEGIGISIDDFGTGYSSLSYLKKLPFSILKIDKSFIGDLLEDRDDTTLIETILDIAANFDLEVVAEGVETEAQYRFLESRHCTYLQGYLCSAPLPVDSFEALIRDHKGRCPGSFTAPA
jgi:diguanylate cyclase (GGDEF)-like protein/PAS domain S-box-containing protein